jgi:hypothetical protein
MIASPLPLAVTAQYYGDVGEISATVPKQGRSPFLPFTLGWPVPFIPKGKVRRGGPQLLLLQTWRCYRGGL